MDTRTQMEICISLFLWNRLKYSKLMVCRCRSVGNNVHSEHKIDYITAILGGKAKIKTVYGY